jgi:hypothetical protein
MGESTAPEALVHEVVHEVLHEGYPREIRRRRSAKGGVGGAASRALGEAAAVSSHFH